MIKLIIRSCVIAVVVVCAFGCKSQVVMSNGAFSDISLTRDSKEYDIKRLKEITTEGRAIFGIPVDKSPSKKQGIVFRFNGVNLRATRGALPVISMIGMSLTTSFLLNRIIGYREESVTSGGIQYNYTAVSDKYKLGLGTDGPIIAVLVGSILTLPLSGAINNQIWAGAAYGRAAYKFNTQLLQENPDIDVFLNPKYEIERREGLWTQHSLFKGKVMGAIIKTVENTADTTRSTK
jgi:hypothetical protein